MKPKPKIVFLQNSANLAGAQKCLFRLLAAPALRERFELEMLIGGRGWLTEACDEAGVSYQVLPFPSARSLTGRLWLSGRFVTRARELAAGAALVHANDHPDALLGLALARALKVPSVLTMRTPGMSHRDFEKYNCASHDALISVGEPIFGNVELWNRGAPHRLVHDGISLAELLPPPSPAARLERVAVIGSLAPRKGWQDLVEALVLMEERGRTNFPRLEFIGDTLGQDPLAVLDLGRLRHCEVEFTGSVADFAARVRGFPLAVHPSRSESFGMAAIETVAAGVPLLAGATGLIPQFVPSRQFLFPPGNVGELAAGLGKIWEDPPAEIQRSFDLPAAQRTIAAEFTLERTIAKMVEIYDLLL